jgi:uncharacterized protein YecT (DUF1311 family)
MMTAIKKIALISIILFFSMNSFGSSDENDCDAIYYGIDTEINHVNAFACYESQNKFDLMIVMSLNGEGVDRDLLQLRNLFLEWARVDPWNANESLHSQALKRALLAAEKGSTEHIDYCNDIAGDTLALNRCAGITIRVSKSNFKKINSRYLSIIPIGSQAAFIKMTHAFQKFVGMDADAAYAINISGSIRGIAAFRQEYNLLDNYATLTARIFEHRDISVTPKLDIFKADRDLNKKYKEIMGFLTSNRNSIYEVDPPNSLKKSQRAWIEYRDAWGFLSRELVMSGFLVNISAEDATATVKKILTDNRISEIESLSDDFNGDEP